MLEIEVDGLFKPLLLLKKKPKIIKKMKLKKILKIVLIKDF